MIVNNNALDKLPQSVCNLVYLRKLHCHSNRLMSLPTNLNRLTCLTELMAQCNKIKVGGPEPRTHVAFPSRTRVIFSDHTFACQVGGPEPRTRDRARSFSAVLPSPNADVA